MRFSGQKIAVTGGAGEIGGRIVDQLLREGASVTVLDRQAPKNPKAGYLECNLANPAGLESLALAMAQTPWDILINLAGVQYFGPMEGESPDSLRLTLAINLLAPMRLAQAVAPGMKARGHGQIVNIGSIFGSINFAHFASYSSSKAGLRAFSQALRRELTGTGVAVTYIAPRAVKTGFNSAKVLQFAALTKMAMDEPGHVAARIVAAIADRKHDVYLGYPEAIFVRLNAVCPALVDRALAAADRRVSQLFA